MKFRIVENVDNQDVEEIHGKLKEYNNSKREPSKRIPLGVFFEEDGEKKAGLTGEVFGNWFCIEYLWVSGELRGQGLGSKLLKSAEKAAAQYGAKYVFVDTFDFQAPHFYVKHGFKQVFMLSEYPYTGARYYYIKQL